MSTLTVGLVNFGFSVIVRSNVTSSVRFLEKRETLCTCFLPLHRILPNQVVVYILYSSRELFLSAG